VSQAIVSHLASTGGSCVICSLAHLGERVHTLFPGISRTLKPFRLDLAKDRIPVLPSAHYHVGGVESDLDGRTSVPHLFVAGEVASSDSMARIAWRRIRCSKVSSSAGGRGRPSPPSAPNSATRPRTASLRANYPEACCTSGT
jgi:hypothetical protein